MLFNVTFEIITEESAEHGEAESNGFELESVPFRDAYSFLRWSGGHCEASDGDILQARWLTFYGEMDPWSGEYRNYSLHFPENLTGSTRRRIAKLFKCYGVR